MTTKARAYREGGRAATAGRGLDTNPYAVRRSGVAPVADVAALTRYWIEGYMAKVERVVDRVLTQAVAKAQSRKGFTPAEST